jgi:hypothetical protein
MYVPGVARPPLAGRVVGWQKPDLKGHFPKSIRFIPEATMTPDTPKPDTTARSAPSEDLEIQEETEILRATAGEATASHKPSEERPSATEDLSGEYVLERESDGRYRIVGRRLRDHKEPNSHEEL